MAIYHCHLWQLSLPLLPFIIAIIIGIVAIIIAIMAISIAIMAIIIAIYYCHLWP